MSTTAARIDPAKTAVVFIEFQNEFAAEGGKLYPAVKDVMKSNNMLKNASETMAAARKVGCKIMHVPISFSSDYKEMSHATFGILANIKAGECFVKGSWGADFENSMKPDPKDVIVQGKSGLCGFESTNLGFLLGHNHIENVVLAGFLTNVCVESTMRSAYEKGFKVITLTDCTAATSQQEQEASTKHTYPMFSTPMTHSEFLAKLK